MSRRKELSSQRKMLTTDCFNLEFLFDIASLIELNKWKEDIQRRIEFLQRGECRFCPYIGSKIDAELSAKLPANMIYALCGEHLPKLQKELLGR